MGEVECAIRGCAKSIFARGWCAAHYSAWKRHGDPLGGRSKAECIEEGCTRRVNGHAYCQLHTQQMRRRGEAPEGAAWSRCSVEGCERFVEARGYCKSHYRAWGAYGDPLARKKAKWGTGYVNNSGYRVVGRKLEHRAVMEKMLGRPLERHETVHHINGDKLDNREENLELRVGRHGVGASGPHCATCACFESSP